MLSSLVIRRSLSTVSKSAPIGIVGFGQVGSAVAKNLLRNGYALTGVHDINPSVLTSLPSSVKRCSNPREVAEVSEVTVTALPGPPEVKQAFYGDDGLLAGLKSGDVWIEHSTTDYEQTLEFAAKVQEKGAEALEAPVTGGMALLRQGNMTILAGGNEETYKKCIPILKQCGKNLIYLGPMGSATITKIVTNMLASTNTVAMGEALMIAKRAGIDLKSYWDAVRFSAGNSYVWETEVPLVFNGTYDPHFTLKLQCKDMNLGYNLARKFGLPLELHSLVEQVYNRARLTYGDDAGSSHPPKLTEDQLNAPCQIEGFDDWTYTVENVNGSLCVVHKKKGDPLDS